MGPNGDGVYILDMRQVEVAATAIHPNMFDFILGQAMNNAEPKIKKEIATHYEKFTRSWSQENRKVDIKTEMRRTASLYELRVYSDSAPFVYVAIGRRRRRIRSKRGKSGLLKFEWDGPGTYIPATQRGSLDSVQRVKGERIVAYPSVLHPGNKPRRPDEKVVRQFKAELVNIVVEEIEKEMHKRINRALSGVPF